MNIRNVDNAPYSEKHGTYGGASGFKDGLIIDGQDCDELPDKACSPIRKEFYKQSLALRLELILEPEYEKILNN